MKNTRIAAFLMAAAMALSAASCTGSRSNPSTETSANTVEIATTTEKEIEVKMNEEADEHDTIFKLNSVIDCGERTDENEAYIFLNVTIKNSSDTDYKLNALNNFIIILPDGSETHFNIRTQLYAQKNFSDLYQENPIIVPAHGEFTGYVGGYLVDQNIRDFTVCFYPTRNDAYDKSSVVKCDITSNDILPMPDELKK
ncbi:MAG: hypothetical protein II690_03085 [Ruminococcus sp.]|nr:hypothetical protein [Ruminococcus sp.]